ncbi:hypothetical protein ACFLZH_04425 [Patescibacteria group bacterium]
MEGIETNNGQPLEYNKRIPGLNPDELQVDDYLNLETESGSRYIFRVVSKNEEDRVVIEFISGPNALEETQGKLADTKIELGKILNYKGGTTNILVGIVVTQGAPYEYPYVKLEYDLFLGEPDLEELDSDQLLVGDHIYFGTEDGQTYVAEVIDVSEEMPLIRFVAGRNIFVGNEGYLETKNLRIGMQFRNTVSSTMPIQHMFVLPDMDENMLDVMDKELVIQELEYDAEIESFYISQLQDGDCVHIETAGSNNSTYVIAFNNGVIKIVGGKNDYVGEVGSFLRGKISIGHRLRSTIVRTSRIKSIRVTKSYYGEVDSLRQNLEERQIAAANCPASSLSKPVMWFGIPSGIHELEIFDALGLTPNGLQIDDLQRAWEKYQQANNPDNHWGITPDEYNKKIRRYRRLERQYQDLIQTLERMKNSLEGK